MSSPGSLDLQVYQGDDFELALDFDIDLTGHTWLSQLRRTPAAVTATAFTVTVTSAANGQIEVTMADTLTVGLEPGDYVWDLQSTDGAGTVRTWLAGKAVVTAEVSR